MSMQRISISLPEYLYDNLIQCVPVGRISRFAAQALEKQLMDFQDDPIEEFAKMRGKLPKIKRAAILKAIREGRK